jgi:UDP-glucose 4-epimerase
MRVLVTGGAGFIGSYLVPMLLEKGAEVVVFDVAAQPTSLGSIRDRITYIRGDLASPADLYRAMMSQAITDVFHLGSILAGPCEENPIMGFRVNFQSTQALLDASLALKVNRFVMVSSISVFGRDVAEPVRDDAVKRMPSRRSGRCTRQRARSKGSITSRAVFTPSAKLSTSREGIVRPAG